MFSDSVAGGEVYMDGARETNKYVARQSRDASREVVEGVVGSMWITEPIKGFSLGRRVAELSKGRRTTGRKRQQSCE
jgi:hypothetical protein